MNDPTPVRPDKFRAFRARKKAAGLREVRLWVPDLRSPAFQAQAAREAAILCGQAEEAEALDFIEAMVAEDAEYLR